MPSTPSPWECRTTWRQPSPKGVHWYVSARHSLGHAVIPTPVRFPLHLSADYSATEYPTMQPRTIGFIGGGNMAVSLIGGLLADGTPASQLWASAPSEATRLRLKEHFAIQVVEQNSELVRHCSVVVLAVKPQKMHEVC